MLKQGKNSCVNLGLHLGGGYLNRNEKDDNQGCSRISRRLSLIMKIFKIFYM